MLQTCFFGLRLGTFIKVKCVNLITCNHGDKCVDIHNSKELTTRTKTSSRSSQTNSGLKNDSLAVTLFC